MTYVAKLLELDRRLRMRLPMAPIRTRTPTESERRLREIMREDARTHAQVLATTVGISPA